MANIAFQRLQREFKEVITSTEIQQTGVKLETLDDHFTVLKGEIRGPPDTPYENGCFLLDIEIPNSYPFKPPEVKFRTKIWHPNISSQTGAICLDILKDQWAASMTLRTVLLSIQALLCVPEPSDPQDAVVAKQCLNNWELFKQTARFWSQTYANAGGEVNLDFQKKVKQLSDMGVTPDAALAALSSGNWDLAQATERIFS